MPNKYKLPPTGFSSGPETPPPSPVSLLQLFRYARPRDRLCLFFGAFIAIITGFSWNLLTIAFGDVVDLFVRFERSQTIENAIKAMNTSLPVTNGTSFAANETSADYLSRDLFLSQIYEFSGGLLALWAANSVCNYLILALFPIAALNQIRVIKTKYFQSLLKQDITWFDKTQAGADFASRVTADLKRIEEGLAEKLGLALYNASTAVIAILVAFVYGWKLTLIVISLLPFLAFGTSVMNKVQATFARKEVESYARAATVAEEVISAIRTVFAFGGQRREVERYERLLKPALRSGIKRNLMTGLGNGIMFACLYAGLALGIWFGVQMILESRAQGSEEYTIGTIVIVFWCVSGAGFSIGGAAPHFEAISVARATAARVFQIIERKPEIDSSREDLGIKRDLLEARIELRNVTFSYPARPEVRVLDGLSMHVKAGESLALVGPSGSGKSTIIQLIQRFYDPQEGHVTVGGVDLKDWNVGHVRREMGVVGQEPVLFDTSIRENIALGSHRKYLEEKDILLAAEEANANTFIQQLPQKYETRVGDRGAQLSGGQKQRIAIARALISSPKILLLDEATSALDMRSESLVQTALERASRGRTTIVVAHRLSTVQHCDRILYLESGKVLEEGTHAQLMQRKHKYFELVRKQQKTIEEEENGNEEEISQIEKKNKKDESVEEEEDEIEDVEEREERVLKRFSQWRLWRLMSRDKYWVLFGLFLSLLYGLVVPIYAFIFGAFVEVFATDSDSARIWQKSREFSFFYCAIAAAVGTISVSQMTCLGVAGERLTARLRRMAFEAILRQDIQWFDKQDNSCGALCARLSQDAANVQGASGSRMAIVLQAFSTFAASAILGFILNWKLSLVASLFIPFILIGSALSASFDQWELKANRQSNERAAKVALEALLSIRTVQSLNRENHFSLQFRQIVDSNAKTSQRKLVLRAFTLSFALSVVFLSYAVVFLLGGLLAANGQLQSGHFFIIIETLIYGSMTVGQSSVFTSDYRKAKVAAANIFRLIDRKSNKSEEKTESLDKKTFKGEIRFESVRFSYPSRVTRGRPVLNGLSFSVSSGQTVALVGASGSGKSTSVQLLERFYDVTGGQILLDGRPLETLNKESVRREMALVSQEPSLFSLTIRENIEYGDNAREVAFEEVVRAAERANIHEFIKDLPNGYETNVGSKGAQLSGGQKQRIAIARALVRDPRVLLLDEATSALDTASESLVQKALEEASRDRTCLVIAHRLSTVRRADKIIVMERGHVAEEGTHEQLLDKKGLYYSLYSLN